jgi:type I restriction enzyme, R subunit
MLKAHAGALGAICRPGLSHQPTPAPREPEATRGRKDHMTRPARPRVSLRLARYFVRRADASIKARLAELDHFWEKEQTKADVEVFILDGVFASLPTPPFTPEEKKRVAANVYAHVWQQAMNGELAMAA